MESATRKQAMRVARMLGCYGAHQDAEGRWMPCVSHEVMTDAIRGQKKVRNEKSLTLSVQTKVDVAGSKSTEVFKTREEAVLESKKRRCGGVRTIMRNGVPVYSICNNGQPIPKRNDFEKLGERGVLSIDTLSGGGLVSGKTLQVEQIDAKGFVNYVSRSTDPDVYTDPDSARVRARQLGCIGIRSYRASDGKIVYLPCTTSPDYNRVRGLRNDGRPKKKDEVEEVIADEKSGAKTPAPKKDRIIGSSRNSVGSASSVSSGSDISLTIGVENALISKVREHNSAVKDKKKEDWSKTSLRALKSVYRRGAGAFSVSHRPNMNRNQWAMGRVNAFLKLLMTGSAKASYTTDNDLLPDGHPWKEKGTKLKSFTINGVNYKELDNILRGSSERRGVAKNVTRHYVLEEIQEI
jgi:hypothetical protein